MNSSLRPDEIQATAVTKTHEAPVLYTRPAAETHGGLAGGGASLLHYSHVRIDHVSYAVPNSCIADTVQRIGSTIGGRFIDGGRHPRYGTRNFTMPLADGCYIEVVSPLDHPAVTAKTFGQAVAKVAGEGGGWLGWVVAVDDIAPITTRLGRAASQGSRRRSDGVELQWQQIGVTDLLHDPQLPFFVEWGGNPADHPSNPAPEGISIEALEICGDEGHISEWLGSPISTALGGIKVSWVDADEPGLAAVHFKTPNGVVRID